MHKVKLLYYILYKYEYYSHYHFIINPMNLQLIVCNHVLNMWLVTYWDHSIYSPPVSSGVRVNRYEVVCVCFVDRCLSVCSLFFVSHCVVCPVLRILVQSLSALKYFLIYFISNHDFFSKFLSRRVWRYQRDNQNP
jgi:hypothetical protein